MLEDETELGVSWMVEAEEKLTEEEALFLSELPSEEFDEQLRQLRSHRNQMDLCGVLRVMDEPIGSMGEESGDMDALTNLFGGGALKQFQVDGQVATIDSAIGRLSQAIKLSPNGHPNKTVYFNNLGNFYLARFERLGEVSDISKVVESYVSAIELTPNGHPNKPMYLNNLGSSFITRFERLGETADIDKAIESQASAVQLTPDGHPDKPMILNNLGGSHLARFERLGEMADIDKAIKYQLTTVELTPDGHPGKPTRLNNLGQIHFTRFEHLGEMADIDKAIESQASAVDLTPDGHPDKPMNLSNLGNSHLTRFERLGEIADIDKAIKYQLSAVELTPDGHPSKPMCLNNLGQSHFTRFERLGEMADIDKAIESQASAVDLSPDGHPDKLVYLNNLGSSRVRRFENIGEMADIENAIESQLSAVQLTPNGHPNKPGRLNNLGNSHVRRFERLGEMADLDKAIESQASAVELTPDGHPDKPMNLSNLGNSHLTRFERLGNMTDIDRAIVYQLTAVELTPDGHPGQPMCLNNLGQSHLTRFERLGEMADLDKAIESQVGAVQLTPDSHPNKPMYLNNLGSSYRTRFERLGEMSDVDKAIEFLASAVQLTPNNHPSQPDHLNNVGNSYLTRFELRGEIADIDKAIQSQLVAVDLTPDGHPNKPGRIINLGNYHLARFERLGELVDIEQAITNFEQSATSVSGPPIIRFRAARAWIYGLSLKEKISDFKSLGLQPQHTLINLIPELVGLGASFHRHFQTIQDVIGSSIHDAVCAAIRSQEFELAVEWFEQGRSIVWNQLRQLRSPLVDLQDAYPFLAQEFQNVQHRIEMSFVRHGVHDKAGATADSLEQQAQTYRCNNQKREMLLAEIRSKRGFESFLRPEKFSVLSKACPGRLVALLNVFEEHCDALIILPSSSITHLSLVDVSQDYIDDLHTQWERSRMTRLSNRGDERQSLPDVHHALKPSFSLKNGPSNGRGEPVSRNINPLTSLLSDLWEKIVFPIVNAAENVLCDSASDKLAHIIWCPSGPLSFLPLHAAGIYGSSSQAPINISDFAASSYTPSLTALLSNPAQLGHPSILMVTQPDTPNQTPLPGTLHEAEKIMQQATLNAMQRYVHHLSQSEATVLAVAEQLQSHEWVHLACHGIQGLPDPMESSFALHDGGLTLAALMQKSMGRAQFAFLSACQTATGDRALPDEAMHLTSGMLAAGCLSVVGTMWAIEDTVVPEVAEAFYAILFEEGRKSDWKAKPEPAYALHYALQSLRRESTGDRDLMKWVPFVHYGI